MSRVIKFRAWDGRKMHFDGPLLKVTGNALMLLDPHIKDDRWIDLKKDCIFMQFTGLHDKDGKEIYEGDIVSTTDVYSNAIHLVEYFGSKFTANNRMRPKESAWLSDNGKCYDLDFLNSYGAGLSVIGNIHESPELI